LRGEEGSYILILLARLEGPGGRAGGGGREGGWRGEGGREGWEKVEQGISLDCKILIISMDLQMLLNDIHVVGWLFFFVNLDRIYK